MRHRINSLWVVIDLLFSFEFVAFLHIPAAAKGWPSGLRSSTSWLLFLTVRVEVCSSKSSCRVAVLGKLDTGDKGEAVGSAKGISTFWNCPRRLPRATVQLTINSISPSCPCRRGSALLVPEVLESPLTMSVICSGRMHISLPPMSALLGTPRESFSSPPRPGTLR